MVFEKYVKVRHEKFGAVVFETLREKIFVTNGAGAEILRLLEEKKNAADVVAQLTERYSSNPETIKADVEEFVRRLQDNGIIRDGVL